ncbi:MAG: DUF1294 domain-containing protein [Selenomonadaceae bacterium]|nr:DUF1294 domain-containing protein [Selenomonadaceae bacterium]
MEIYEHNVITWYLVILNVVAILIYGWDKVCAMRQWWRVPELTLLLFDISRKVVVARCTLLRMGAMLLAGIRLCM